MKLSAGFTVMIALTVPVPAACSREPDTAANPASAMNNDEAIRVISVARCEREQVCQNIGEGKTWATRAACTETVVHDERVELRGEECPGGVGEVDVEDCTRAILSQRCSNPLDAMSTLMDCRKGKLCRGER